RHHHGVDPLELIDRDNNPVWEWGWAETKPNRTDLGVAETLFAQSNGYLGMRGNPPEGRDSAVHGTYINGVYENWKITHAEDAYGLARDGQSIIDVPDAKAMRLYIDDEPLRLGNADISEYSRTLDFRDGVLRRSMIWRTPGGKRVRVTTERMVSFQERHLAIMALEVELLDSDAAVVVSSQLLNRQDGEGEFPDNNGPVAVQGGELDPRKGSTFDERVLIPKYQSQPEPERATLGYQVNHSARHVAQVSLAVRCSRSINPWQEVGYSSRVENQREWLGEFWERSAVRIGSQPELQQAARWCIFQPIQASTRAETTGVPAKGLTGAGYGGHYFWDTEIYEIGRASCRERV